MTPKKTPAPDPKEPKERKEEKRPARPERRDAEAVRCLAILVVRHLLDAVVVPAHARLGARAMDAEERLDLVAAGIVAAESLMRKNLPLTLRALARRYDANSD